MTGSQRTVAKHQKSPKKWIDALFPHPLVTFKHVTCTRAEKKGSFSFAWFRLTKTRIEDNTELKVTESDYINCANKFSMNPRNVVAASWIVINHSKPVLTPHQAYLWKLCSPWCDVRSRFFGQHASSFDCNDIFIRNWKMDTFSKQATFLSCLAFVGVCPHTHLWRVCNWMTSFGLTNEIQLLNFNLGTQMRESSNINSSSATYFPFSSFEAACVTNEGCEWQ